MHKLRYYRLLARGRRRCRDGGGVVHFCLKSVQRKNHFIFVYFIFLFKRKSSWAGVERVLDAPLVRVNLDTDFARLPQLCNAEELP